MANPSVVEVTPARFDSVGALVARIADEARAVGGHPVLGDAVWLDLEHPRADSAGFLVGEDAYAHVARADNDAAREWTLGLAVAPGSPSGDARRALVAAAAEHVRRLGGGRMTLWVLGAQSADDTALRGAGMQPVRDLYEMRVGLPLTEAPRWPPGVQVRAFEPTRDDAAFLAVNNRAFAGHAEQGGWTETTLARRIAEPWFDPTLFLLAFDADGMAGFNWLKVHEPHDRDPRMGEIYVVGVDPRAQGTGLGRALAVGGLGAVHERGIDTGLLFCAADNAPALALYRSLGFEVHRTDRAYECEVQPS